MNQIVIDASCILSYLLNQNEGKKVKDIVADTELVAPSCLEMEIGNALSKFIKRNLLEISDAVLVYHEFFKIPIRTIQPDIPNSIVIAGQDKCYAYDAYYINIAQQFSLPIFTLDEQMKYSASKRGIKCL